MVTAARELRQQAAPVDTAPPIAGKV